MGNHPAGLAFMHVAYDCYSLFTSYCRTLIYMFRFRYEFTKRYGSNYELAMAELGKSIRTLQRYFIKQINVNLNKK